MSTILYDRIYAANAVAPIANSMGDLSEHMTWMEVEETYGFLDKLLPQIVPARTPKQMQWGPPFEYYEMDRVAGQGEDGQERHRLVCEAIIEKGGRIDAWDLGRAWLKHVDQKKFGLLMGPQDQVIYWGMYSGVPPTEIGRYATYPGFHGTSKMIQPIGLVNACNPRQAARDALDVGRIKDVSGFPNNYGLEVAASLAAGCAHALSPNATVGSVIDTVLSYLSPGPRAEVEQGIEWAKQYKDWKKLRELYHDRYSPYPMSDAVENLSSAMALFYLCDGEPYNGVLWAVNMGRDADDRAYDVGCLAAALNGLGDIPQAWLDTVDSALEADHVTVSNRSLKDCADGLYRAAKNEIELQRGVLAAAERIL